MVIRIRLPLKVAEEDVEWLKKVLPGLTAAVLELRRAGRHGHENELIPLFAADVGLSLEDVQEAAREAETIRAVARGTVWATAREIAQLASVGSPRTVNRWKQQGRMFSIQRRQRDYFPRYALGPDFHPLPVVQEVIKILDACSGMELAAWFEQPSAALDGSRPRELVATRPDDVLAAAWSSRTSACESQQIKKMIENRRLLEDAEFLNRLGWTHRVLAQAVGAHRMFFIEHQGKRLFPAFYLDPANNRRQLEAVTKLLEGLPASAKLQFFSNRRGSLSRQTPLQALRNGRLAEVKAAARGFAQG